MQETLALLLTAPLEKGPPVSVAALLSSKSGGIVRAVGQNCSKTTVLCCLIGILHTTSANSKPKLIAQLTECVAALAEELEGSLEVNKQLDTSMPDLWIVSELCVRCVLCLTVIF